MGNCSASEHAFTNEAHDPPVAQVEDGHLKHEVRSSSVLEYEVDRDTPLDELDIKKVKQSVTQDCDLGAESVTCLPQQAHVAVYPAEKASTTTAWEDGPAPDGMSADEEDRRNKKEAASSKVESKGITKKRTRRISAEKKTAEKPSGAGGSKAPGQGNGKRVAKVIKDVAKKSAVDVEKSTALTPMALEIAAVHHPMTVVSEEDEEANALAQACSQDERRQLEFGKGAPQKRIFRASLFAKHLSSKGAGVVQADPEKPLPAGSTHFVKGTRMFPPWPDGMQQAMFGMGCFWCAENLFMRRKGVFSTQVGFAGGKMINPTYDSVCYDASLAKTGETGKQDHVEVVRIIYNPTEISYEDLLKVFWERHNPTHGDRQGRDEGYQYRSFIGCSSGEQKHAASMSRASFAFALKRKGIDFPITTEIRSPAPHFWYAEEVHQQYDAKPNSASYCGLAPTGARLP